ncbi:Basic blue-like protein [Quillaja saponaria]|uniref:Basic blue protein n=1 Tax=Quillaja saponaria TaxID=32244 RepID=A0AAD7P8S1_QUISA|nr:Basic blue-like protein [Quillaja saponaria]
MAQGRGSAMFSMMLVCFLVLQSEMVHAATTYTVGDARGWTFNVVGWPRGKHFRAGDTLVFKYNPQAHNVVAVNNVGYNTCKTPRGAKVFKSGRDQIKLVKGQNYFLCSFVGHCQAGMKIAVNAV